MVRIIHGDALTALQALPDESVHCCVTSPPYWGLRDYGVGGQIGLERTPGEYVEKIVAVFREVRRVLRDDGTLWLNLGDSYASDTKWGGNSTGKNAYKSVENSLTGNRCRQQTGLKHKDLVGIPWMVAFALRADGWYLRQDIIWHKPSPMPESVQDRCTKAHEYIFLLSKSEHYYYDAGAIKEPLASDTNARYTRGRSNHHKWADGGPGNQTIAKGFSHMLGVDPKAAAAGDLAEDRNKRSVWTVASKPYGGAHFATFPPKLIEPCILAGCPAGGVVLDPFAGSGTTGMVAEGNGRDSVLIELNPKYVELIKRRTAQKGLFCAQKELAT
jgi:DNA modification methylase